MQLPVTFPYFFITSKFKSNQCHHPQIFNLMLDMFIPQRRKSHINKIYGQIIVI